MKTITTLIISAGLLSLQGCGTEPTVGYEPEDVVTNDSAVTAGSANVVMTSSWNTGYCMQITLTNGLGESTARWQVLMDLKNTTITNLSGATSATKTGKVTFLPVNYNTYIAPGANTMISFCANAPDATRPVLTAWNMESNAYASCPSNSGLNPTKAALAVAIAKDMGRWDTATDITYDSKWRAMLTPAGLARCTNGCPNVKAILGQQDTGLLSFIDQNVFNPTTLQTDLSAAVGRQVALIQNLKKNSPSQVPPAHKLTMVAGPTNLGKGSCGPHYIFQVDHLDGTPLNSTEASAMANALCFFGQGTCGQNPYIGFAQTTTGCPAGKTCVAVDPTDGDNSSTSTTTAGSAPTYPLNRVYDPSNSLLATQCITTKGLLGRLISKCATLPATCGALYCVGI